MSVNCDKFIGYSIDILEEWSKLDSSIQEKWSKDIKQENKEEFDKAGFTPYYSEQSSLKDTVTILYDGMSGQYCKLVYVIDYEAYAEEENNENIVNTINNLLLHSPVPFSIKKNIKKIYKSIFNKDLNKTSDIKPEYIIHWH